MTKQQFQTLLTWNTPKGSGSYALFEMENKIGRSSDCDLVLEMSSISRHHASIAFENGQYYILDLESSYGTRVNGVRLASHEKKILKSGDEIYLGKLCLFFDREAPSAQEEADELYTMELSFPKIQYCEEIEKFRNQVHDLVDSGVRHPERRQILKKNIDDELTHLNDYFNSKLKEYEVLQEIMQILGRILDVKELLTTALDLVSKALRADRGFIILYDTKHGALRSMIPYHFDQNHSSYKYDLSFSQTIAKACYETKKFILIPDALQDERFRSSESIVASSIRSVACIPLQQGETISGVIYLDNLHEVGCFHEHQTDFLKAFSAQTAIALENARLYTEAVTDSLTRLYNRKYIKERIYEEMIRSHRYNHVCSLIMMDIDFFKKVNDTYGHQVGDAVIEGVANVLRENARATDCVARFGGEEFLMLLPETGREGAVKFAERLRSSVESLLISTAEQKIQVTMSCGVSSYQREYGSNLAPFLEMADQALYRAKETGRNRIHHGDDC